MVRKLTTGQKKNCDEMPAGRQGPPRAASGSDVRPAHPAIRNREITVGHKRRGRILGFSTAQPAKSRQGPQGRHRAILSTMVEDEDGRDDVRRSASRHEQAHVTMLTQRMRSRIRGGLVPLALVLAGCASTRAALPDWVPTILKPTSIVVPSPVSEPSSPPAAPSPAIVQMLTLAAPEGARGRLTLTKTISFIREAQGDPKNPAKPGAAYATVTAYSGSGNISVSDDLGQWTFSYAPIALHDPAPKIQALGIRFQSASADTLEIDWQESALVDPSGNRHRVIHRGDVTPGSGVAVWAGDVGLEALPQGLSVTIVLTLRRGDQRSVKKFVFESRLP